MTRPRIPVVDAVLHARPADLVTAATIYGAAVIATAGLVIASLVDGVLGVRAHDRRVRGRARVQLA